MRRSTTAEFARGLLKQTLTILDGMRPKPIVIPDAMQEPDPDRIFLDWCPLPEYLRHVPDGMRHFNFFKTPPPMKVGWPTPDIPAVVPYETITVEMQEYLYDDGGFGRLTRRYGWNEELRALLVGPTAYIDNLTGVRVCDG